MKNHFKYCMLLSLTLLLAISLVNAQPVKIGQSEQTIPFESNPTAYAQSGLGTTLTTPENMMDGVLTTSGAFTMGTGFGATAYLTLHTFTTPPTPEPFALGWLDIKIKYEVPTALVDDKYRIEYALSDAGPWEPIQADVTGADSAFTPAIVRPQPQAARPGGGTWAWSDLTSLRVRVYCTKTTGWDAKTMTIFEVWVSAYPLPVPKSSSTAVSVQPEVASAVGYFFVDVYAMDLSWFDESAGVTRGLWGYQFTLNYDTSILTALEFFSYYPFKTAAPSGIDDLVGTVSISYATYAGDPTGFIGNTPLARVYFKTDSIGISDLQFTLMELKPAVLETVYPTAYGGKLYARGALSAVDGVSTLVPVIISPGDPKGTYWHELYPQYSRTYTLTSWSDNGDGYLSASDQIDMLDDTGATRWFHVDEVTTTIYFTILDFEMPVVGEPLTPIDPADWPTDPTGTRWHTIQPSDIGFCQRFTIDIWDDTNMDGKFTPSDQFYVTFDDPSFGGPWLCHLDNVSTDIIIAEKPVIPEFPLGIGVLMAIAPLIPIVYIWRLRKRSR